MAISRMQQPRQMYGLGSFVKKATRKATKPFVKLARKLVPKEIAGIMRAAAPFLPPGYREAAYFLGTAKQTGRISPVDLALIAAPTFFSKTNVGQGIAEKVGNLKLPGMERDLKEIAVGSPKEVNFTEFQGPTKDFVAGASELGGDSIVSKGLGGQNIVTEATQGIFGKGGDLNLLKGSLLTKPDGSLSLTKTGSIGVGLLSLIQNSKTPEEAGNALAAATGDSDDYDRGYQMFSALPKGIFDIQDKFRLQSANGGLMRTNYAIGSDDKGVVNPFQPKPQGPVLPEEDKPFRPKPLKPLKMSEDDDKGIMMMAGSDRYQRILEQLINELEDQLGRELTDAEYDMAGKLAYDKLSDSDFAVGGRVGYALGTGRKELTKPMLSDKKEKENMMMAGSDRYQRILEQLINELEDQLGRELTDAEYDMAGRMAYERLSDSDYAVGGRVDYALGTKPTPEESGLGGLPIEADMRYTGGFMPYGAKEKADDVPARLSKNEFVFTADAVRAAGGGSVNEGAKKMYATMKNLEAKPEAKGMTA